MAVSTKVKIKTQVNNLLKSLSKTETEKFEQNVISEVLLRPFIYDKSDSNHMKTQLISKAWIEIGEKAGFCPISDENKMDIDAGICQTKWKNLRDYFYKLVRESKKGHSGDSQDLASEVKTWKWYSSLLFLLDVNKPQPTIDTLDDTTPKDNSSFDSLTPSPATPGSSSSSVSKSGPYINNNNRKRKPSGETGATKWGQVADKFSKLLESTAEIEPPLTANSAFAQYLCAEMDAMNDKRKRAFKSQAMELITKINDDDYFE